MNFQAIRRLHRGPRFEFHPWATIPPMTCLVCYRIGLIPAFGRVSIEQQIADRIRRKFEAMEKLDKLEKAGNLSM